MRWTLAVLLVAASTVHAGGGSVVGVWEFDLADLAQDKPVSPAAFTFCISLRVDGRFEALITDPESRMRISGEYAKTASALVMTPSSPEHDSLEFRYEVTGDKLLLREPDDSRPLELRRVPWCSNR